MWSTCSPSSTSTTPSCPTCRTTCTSYTTDSTSCTTYSTQPIQPVHVPQPNWSHFNPEFTGKPDEDAKAHLLRMNDWMDTHAFQEGIKVQCLCLTLVAEARLWYESLRPINADWIDSQNQLR